jgi:hypothetical protein
LSNKAAAFTAGGFCREQPESARIPAKKAKVTKLRFERGTFIKLAAPEHQDRSTKDAMRVVNGHNFRVEKGKDSSFLRSVSVQFRSTAESLRTQGEMMDFAAWLVG